MTFTEARLRLGMGETAFYKLKNKLGIKNIIEFFFSIFYQITFFFEKIEILKKDIL